MKILIILIILIMGMPSCKDSMSKQSIQDEKASYFHYCIGSRLQAATGIGKSASPELMTSIGESCEREMEIKYGEKK